MDAHDLDGYLATEAPTDMPWWQLRNLVAMRRALGRPLSQRTYEAIRSRLEAEEAGPAVDGQP